MRAVVRSLLPLALAAAVIHPASLAAQAPSGSPASAESAGPSVAAFVPGPVRGAEFELSIRNIMRGPELVGQSPSRVRWTDDSRWVYFRWLPGGQEWDAEPELYRVPRDGGEPQLVPPEQWREAELLTAPGDLSSDRRWRVSAVDGDLVLVNRGTLETRHLTRTESAERDPLFAEGGTSILFREGTNLFRMDLEDGGIAQVTDIRTGTPPEDEEAEGHRAFLEEQQEELFEHIRRRKAREEEQETREEATREPGPEPFYVPRGENLQGLTPNRQGTFVLLSTGRRAGDARETPVPFWVTESGYTESRDTRTKVGDAQGDGRLALLESATGTATWLDGKPEDFEGEVRTVGMGWNDAGTHVLVMGISDDDQHRWIWTVEAGSGERALVEHIYDEAWVGGPCNFGCMGWIPDSDRVWYATEATGFSHLYAADPDGSDREALTSGDWEVLAVEVLPWQDRFLVTTNEGSPFNQHVGWLDFGGGEIDYLTSGEGRYEVIVSPDGEGLAVLHDVANRPPELFLAGASDPDQMARVTTTPTRDWLSFPWLRPEIIRFDAEDGESVPARIYRPGDIGAEGNGAAVIFVHGAGYLHNVHNYWSSYFREYMYHHLLAAQGYTVLDIDYRGSAGYGRDWRTAIYRWMGGKDLSDQVDGARWLVESEGIDPDRIGIYGGSYGGFITLMALFTAGDTFKAGAALRSVTDWAHYNDGYTSNILNDPQEDEEAYRRSSPIYFAEGFGPDQHLLIPHGMVDTNVHFSDVVRLAQRLIELGKENWEMAVYPVENHGFVEPTSWTDEYRRIFELFERTISRPGCTADGGFCAVPRGDR